MKALVFDIETIPDVEGIRKLLPGEDALNCAEGMEQGTGQGETHTGELKDEEVIARFLALRQAAGSEKKNDFLPVHLHRVIVIGIAIAETEKKNLQVMSLHDKDEKVLLKQFFGGIDKYEPQLVSWNGGNFDLPVLHARALMHKVASQRYWDVGEKNPSFRFNHYLNRYQYRHLDLMDVLAGYNTRNFSRLDDMARLCGFPGKKGITGDRVADVYAKGGIEEIRRYCEADVLNTYLLYLRFLLISRRISDSQYSQAIAHTRSWLDDQKTKFWSEFNDNWQESC